MKIKGNALFLFLSRLWDWFNQGLKIIRSRIFPQSLLKRFILIILLPLILLQAIIVIFFYDRHWDTVSKRLALDITGEIQFMADVIRQRPDEDSLNVLLQGMNKNLSLRMSFFPEQVFPDSVRSTDMKESHLYRELRNLKYPFILQKLPGNQLLITVQLPEGVLTTHVPKKRFFTSTVHVFLVWMIGSSILLFWIAFLFMKNQVRSIVRLSKASEQFGMGYATPNFKPEGATEVRQAGYSFILMRDRIQKYLKERTAMLAAVSHDLRTPLTRMKLLLSMMPADENTNDLQTDIEEMEKMLIGYLDFAKGEAKEDPEEILLNTLLENIVRKLVKTGQKIDIHTEQKVEIMGRKADLSRAITNILTNAGRYATYAQVTLGIRDKMATVIVDDNGPGIPENKRGDVFKAFYRLENSRNKETGGIGLGMTIAKDVVLSHGGDITLKSSPLKGLRVVISLPVS